MPLVDAWLRLATGDVMESLLGSRHFVAAWQRQAPVDPFVGPIFKGRPPRWAARSNRIDWHGRSVTAATSRNLGSLNPSSTSALFKEFTRRIGSSLLVGYAYHKNTNAKNKRVNGLLGDTLSAEPRGHSQTLSGLNTPQESSVRSYLVGNAGSRTISEAK